MAMHSPVDLRGSHCSIMQTAKMTQLNKPPLEITFVKIFVVQVENWIENQACLLSTVPSAGGGREYMAMHSPVDLHGSHCSIMQTVKTTQLNKPPLEITFVKIFVVHVENWIENHACLLSTVPSAGGAMAMHSPVDNSNSLISHRLKLLW